MELTLEELKAEAKRQGYSLIKRRPYVKLNLCPICGKKPAQWVSNDGYFYRCNICDLKAPPSHKAYMSRENWNRATEHFKFEEIRE